MIGSRAILLGALAFVQVQAASAQCTPVEFRDWFHAAARGDLRVPRPVERRAQGLRYVFVGGFASEGMPGYFSQSAKELRAHGVPRGSIHYIFPSSHESMAGNGAAVRSKFRELAELGPERLVVIAHSRGACDALAFAFENASFVDDHVEALFLVQGAFGGTGAADYVMGEGLAMDSRMPARLRALGYLVGRFEKFVMHRGGHGGVRGLTREKSREFWCRMKADHADSLEVVGPKTFYVTSRARPSRLRLFRRAIASYLHIYYGPNDGIIAVDDQTLPGVGTCLAELDASHTDLTHRFPATRAPRRFRRALIQSILMAVGGDEEEQIARFESQGDQVP